MAHPALQVTSGDTLQMQFVADNDTTRPRLTVSVIGQINGRSLLVSHPSTGGRLLLVRDGQPVACRMFSDGRMLGFRTTVRKVVTHPDAYLHLDYPRTLEQRVLRRAPRVPVELAGRIRCINSTSSHAVTPSAGGAVTRPPRRTRPWRLGRTTWRSPRSSPSCRRP